MAENYLEVPKYKPRDLRGLKTNECCTHCDTLALQYAISQSLILGWVPRVHEQHMQVHKDGACCLNWSENREMRMPGAHLKSHDLPAFEWLFSRLLSLRAIMETCPFPHHLNALLMAGA